MLKIKDIVAHLENVAPLSLQESYDNAGLIVGNMETEVSNITISLDCTEQVIQDAIDANSNLIVSHHPIIFKGLKKITGDNYVERTILKAIKNDIAIYATHTNLDSINTGVNRKISEKLKLRNVRILKPKESTLQKLETFVPIKNTNEVLNALFNAGAGDIGEYSHCSFASPGEGSFLPKENANPHIGKTGTLENVDEQKIEVVFPFHKRHSIVNALKKSHPYEEVAYYVLNMVNTNPELGSGMIGELESEMSEQKFLEFLKSQMELKVVKHTHLLKKPIQKIAVCGGAGSFLINNARKAGANVFITSDFKYHEFFDAENEIILMDIGHYESEIYTNELLYEILSKKFPNIALRFTKVNTNPILYS